MPGRVSGTHRVLSCETQDHLAGLDGGGWSSRLVRVGPVVGDESSMPPQNRVRFDHEDGPAVTAEYARERGKDGAVVGFEPRTDMLALQHRELVT
jgi:hypothetical protein